MIVDQSGMENDPLADINQQEAAESPDAGFYGLWDYGPSDFKKSFLNCEAIPFAVCMYTRNRFIRIDSDCNFQVKKPFSQNVLILNENESIKRAGLFSAVILIVPAMLLALLSAAVLASHGQIHTTGTLARASRNFV